MFEPQPAEWRPIPSPRYDWLPRSWLVFDEAVEKAGRLIYGPAWSGWEHIARESEAAALSAIQTLSDEDMAPANEWRLKLVDRVAGRRRARLAAEAPQGGTVRAGPRDDLQLKMSEADISKAIDRARAADREALERSQTDAGRAAAWERQKELTRECLEHRASKRWRPHCERWDEARHQLGCGIEAGKIAASVWLRPSSRFLRLHADEARRLLPAPREGSRVKFDGEPGLLVVSTEDIDRVFSPNEAAAGKSEVNALPVHRPDRRREEGRKEQLKANIRELAATGQKTGVKAVFKAVRGSHTKEEVAAAVREVFPERRQGRPLGKSPRKESAGQ